MIGSQSPARRPLRDDEPAQRGSHRAGVKAPDPSGATSSPSSSRRAIGPIDDRAIVDGPTERVRLIALGVLTPAEDLRDHFTGPCLRLDARGRVVAAKRIADHHAGRQAERTHNIEFLESIYGTETE